MNVVDLLSDDSDGSSSDLPQIYIQNTCKKDIDKNTSCVNTYTSTKTSKNLDVTLHQDKPIPRISTTSSESEDDCVDLTQEDMDINKSPLADRFSNNYSFSKESDKTTPSCSGTDSNLNTDENDELFDVLVQNTLDKTESTKAIKGKGKSPKAVKTKQNKEGKENERLAKKQKVVEEKAAKRALLDQKKCYKPSECIKHMYVEAHPDLLSKWYMNDLKNELSSVGANVSACHDIADECSVMWSRRSDKKLIAENGQMNLGQDTEASEVALLVLESDEVANLVKNNTLAQRVANASAMTQCRCTLVAFGMKEYFKKIKRKKKDGITEIQLEMAITDLLVSTNCDAMLVDTANELALLIVRFTKAIAEAPYKKAKRDCDDRVDFYMRGDNKKTIGVDKDGRGLRQVWQQMLAILPQSSLEIARAICSDYQSPLSLYEECGSIDAVQRLAEIGVQRSNVPEAKSRNLGTGFSRKLHKFFTATDGDILLD